MALDVNDSQTVIERQEVECNREFTVNSELNLADGAKLTSGITAELAPMTIISSGELNYYVALNPLGFSKIESLTNNVNKIKIILPNSTTS